MVEQVPVFSTNEHYTDFPERLLVTEQIRIFQEAILDIIEQISRNVSLTLLLLIYNKKVLKH